MRLRVARQLQQQDGWVFSQVLVGRPPPTPQQALPNLVPHLDFSELWTLPACHPQAPLIFRGGVSLVRENSLDSGALDLAGSPAHAVLPVPQTELLTWAPVGNGALSVPSLLCLEHSFQITS